VIVQAAQSYLRAGLCVLPANLERKFTTLPTWKAFQSCLPSEAQVAGWFADARAICIIAGAVSGNLEAMDFDCRAEAFAAWREIVHAEAPNLLPKLVLERSQSWGRHLIYRLAGGSTRSTKLARKVIVLSDEQVAFRSDGTPETDYCGKKYVPRKVDGRWRIEPCLIETKGEGGLFLCAPSPGYVLEQGRFEDVPVLSEEEHEIILRAARSLDEGARQPAPSGDTSTVVGGRPGDDFNERGDVRDVLLRHGWTLARPGENEYWRRPGKSLGSSATLKDRVFYVFSSNAPPFEPETAYSPFRVCALLEHEGDYAAAASSLRARGFGQEPDVSGVDLSAFQPASQEPDSTRDTPEDPGPVPEDLLHVPGFIDQVMRYTLRTAPYPDTVLAFCGAVSLQALLAGRKVRDETDNRTSLYLLGLANSGVGKDHPRKVNQRILLYSGLSEAFAETFASGEGLEDRLLVQPAMLFQTDEMDGLITAIARGKEIRFEGIMNVLLKMYTSANGIYAMRVKAGKNANRGVIDQPCLCIFGTAIPKNFYESLSSKMLANGFFARMLILETGKRAKGQDHDGDDVPEGIIAVARYWAELRMGKGNLENWHPTPRVVPQTAGAKAILAELRSHADDQYSRAEAANDTMGMAIWARANEKARRFALVHACSENHAEPVISEGAARWASDLVSHQTRRMIYMAFEHASENEFDAKRKRVLREIRSAAGGRITRTALCRRLRAIPSRERDEIILALLEAGDVRIATKTQDGPGAPGQEYVAC
jgi:hypothetical protein